MSVRETEFIEGEYYHIYSRGNSKQKIFLDDKDRERFLKLLYLCNSKQRIDFSNDIVKRKINAWDFEKGEPIVNIGAWVLMSNHFHLYVTQKTEAMLPSGSAITDFMHRVLTAYSKYFNAKYSRVGSLFENKFRSVHITKDTQAKYLFSYIHLNPIKLVNPKWKENGIKDLVILHCSTTYTHEPDFTTLNLKNIADIKSKFDVIPGFSENIGGTRTAAMAVLAGAKVIEKHVMPEGKEKTPEPTQFKELKLDNCPDCGNELEKPKYTCKKIQEDIPYYFQEGKPYMDTGREGPLKGRHNK